MADHTRYSVPKEPGRWRALALAALVHLALLAFFWIGIRWQNETPATIEAEVWDPVAKEAAPTPQPTPRPEPQQPQPVVPPPPPPAETPVPKQPTLPKPDIALEQEKKRKALEQKHLAEEREREAEVRKKKIEEEHQAELKRKADAERLAKQKEEQERQERIAKEKEREKEQQQRLAKQKEEQEKAKKLAAEKAAAEAKRKQQEAAENKLAAKMREEDLKRMTAGAVGTGGSGEAARSQGGRADSGYAARVAAKIRSNISFVVPEGLANNPEAEFVVNLLPDGSVASVRKTRSSGVPGFDEAVLRAIEKSQPYPRDKSGSVPSSFIGVHRPKDQ
jgi:colicin import membrane protein